jgi:hypothetical protein
LEVAPAPLSGRIDPTAIEQGKSARVTCNVEAGELIAVGAIATLEGLPPRATAKEVRLQHGNKQIDFQVSVDSTTPVGEYTTLVCRLACKIKEQELVYRIGRGGLLNVLAPGATQKSSDGKPLSPLESLRLRERVPAPKPAGPGRSGTLDH